MFGVGAVWSYGDLVVDGQAWEVRLRGQLIDLTRTEFEILAVLASRPRRVVTSEELTRLIWGDNWFGDEGNIAVHVSKLRHKLGESGLAPRYIRTVRGVGYRFEPSPGRFQGKPDATSAFEMLRSRAGAVEVRTGGDLRVTEIVPAAAPVLGWDPRELVGRYFPVGDDPTWQHHAAAREVISLLISSGVREWSSRHRIRRYDGSAGVADVVTRIAVGRDGQLSELHFVFVEVDDSELVKGGGVTAGLV